MTRLRGEYVYTATGRQRPVFLCADCAMAQFAVDHGPADSVRVEVSFDPHESLRRGQGRWLPYDGGMGGGVYGVTAIRLAINRVEAWLSLTLEQHRENNDSDFS